jgi:hypothetical protein
MVSGQLTVSDIVMVGCQDLGTVFFGWICFGGLPFDWVLHFFLSLWDCIASFLIDFLCRDVLHLVILSLVQICKDMGPVLLLGWTTVFLQLLNEEQLVV